MERYTKKENNRYSIGPEYIEYQDGFYIGDSINRLAEFENIVEEILNQQLEISRTLEELRTNDETKSYKFRENLGHKLVNSAIINILEQHNII